MSHITASQGKYDLFVPGFYANPFPTFHRMRAEDPVYWEPTLGTWFLTRYADVQRLVRDDRFSVERVDHFGQGASPECQHKLARINRFLSYWLVLADPPRHTRLRALISKAFTPHSAERLRFFIHDVVDARLAAVRSRGRMDVVSDLAAVLPGEVIARMLGVPASDIEKFHAWSAALMALLGFSGHKDKDEAVATAHDAVLGFEDYFRDIIPARRKRPTDDILSDLIAAEEQGSMLSGDELISFCAMLLVAGHETTMHLIGNSILMLLQNPGELARLRSEPTRIASAVEEFLRYDGAVFQLGRRARQDVDIDGRAIRAGQVVFGLVHAANRDPAHFPDPDRLDITRHPNRHLGFGYGIHFCVGAAIARMETQIAVGAMVQRLDGLALTDEPLRRIPSMAIRGLESLPVTFTP